MPPDRLTPSELRERRRALSLSQGQLARSFGVGERTVSRWETGALDIPVHVDLSLRCLEYEAGLRRVPKRAA